MLFPFVSAFLSFASDFVCFVMDLPPYYQGSLPLSSLSSLSNTNTQEIKLYTTSRERSTYDNLADLYSILITTEHLEKAFLRDTCSPEEYTSECKKLIAQFKTAISLLENFNLDAFVRDYNIDCEYAINRLVKKGIPATVEHDFEVDPPSPSPNIGSFFSLLNFLFFSLFYFFFLSYENV